MIALTKPKTDIKIWTDASETGYGIVTKDYTYSRYWTIEIAQESSNYRKTKTAAFAVLLLAPKLRGKTLQIVSDNTTCVSIIKKLGTTSSEKLLKLAKEIHWTAINNRVQLQASYLEGHQNVVADLASQKAERHDYAMKQPWFHLIERQYKTEIVEDFFASNASRKTDLFWTQTQDAFQQLWPQWNGYAFPPPKLVFKGINKALTQKVQQIFIVTPAWKSHHWLPMIRQLCTKGPLWFPAHTIQLESRFRDHGRHPTENGVLV